jgi:hypothetical protein
MSSTLWISHLAGSVFATLRQPQVRHPYPSKRSFSVSPWFLNVNARLERLIPTTVATYSPLSVALGRHVGMKSIPTVVHASLCQQECVRPLLCMTGHLHYNDIRDTLREEGRTNC